MCHLHNYLRVFKCFNYYIPFFLSIRVSNAGEHGFSPNCLHTSALSVDDNCGSFNSLS